MTYNLPCYLDIVKIFLSDARGQHIEGNDGSKDDQRFEALPPR